jgi:uncharacterized BrkB/YihY/UPF0761 family membrane protein
MFLKMGCTRRAIVEKLLKLFLNVFVTGFLIVVLLLLSVSINNVYLRKYEISNELARYAYYAFTVLLLALLIYLFLNEKHFPGCS